MEQKKLRKEKNKGSITLYVLVSCMFFVIVLGLTYVNLVSKAQRTEEDIRQIQYNYDKDAGKIMTENTKFIDSNGDTAIIPAGFCVVKGATVIANGLVISDVENDDVDNSKGGNQFVWIPVDGVTLRYEKDTTTWSDESNSYNDYTDWVDDGGNATSVSTYKGFYIARFEAGIPSDAPFANDASDNTYKDKSSGKNTGDYAPVSKKNTKAWNFINQENAKIAASKMYTDSTSVTSSLVDSYAWDTITHWISNSGYNVIDSASWGNHLDSTFSYSGLCAKHLHTDTGGWSVASSWSTTMKINANERTEILTGASSYCCANNIYDLAGNMWEWTTEQGNHNGTSDTYAVHRGGSINFTGASCSMSCRGGSPNSESHYYVDIGFRVVMYIK